MAVSVTDRTRGPLHKAVVRVASSECPSSKLLSNQFFSTEVNSPSTSKPRYITFLSTNMSEIPTCYLTNIPYEVRRIILEHLLVSNAPIGDFADFKFVFPARNDPPSAIPHWEGVGEPRNTEIYPNIISTCHQLYREGTEILYKKNTLTISVLLTENHQVLVHALNAYCRLPPKEGPQLEDDIVDRFQSHILRGFVSRFENVTIVPRHYGYPHPQFIGRFCAWFNSQINEQAVVDLSAIVQTTAPGPFSTLQMLRLRKISFLGVNADTSAQWQETIQGPTDVQDVPAMVTQYLRFLRQFEHHLQTEYLAWYRRHANWALETYRLDILLNVRRATEEDLEREFLKALAPLRNLDFRNSCSSW